MARTRPEPTPLDETTPDVADSRPLIVGEANPYGSMPDFALYPQPPNCAGDRLCRMVMGLEPETYLERLQRVNLVHGEWRVGQATANARALLRDRIPPARFVVLLGARVHSAFARAMAGKNVLPGAYELPRVVGQKFLLLPHPSGRCRTWNRPRMYEDCRAALSRIDEATLPDGRHPRIPFGEARAR